MIKGGPLTKFNLGYVDGLLWDIEGGFGWQFRDGTKLYVPDQFRHDFNSIPRLFWRILPPTQFGEAGTIHDWMYRNCGALMVIDVNGVSMAVQWDRAECDRRYREILEDTNAPKWKRRLMYSGVRSGGWKAWGDHEKRIKAETAAKLKDPVRDFMQLGQ